MPNSIAVCSTWNGWFCQAYFSTLFSLRRSSATRVCSPKHASINELRTFSFAVRPLENSFTLGGIPFHSTLDHWLLYISVTDVPLMQITRPQHSSICYEKIDHLDSFTCIWMHCCDEKRCFLTRSSSLGKESGSFSASH